MEDLTPPLLLIIRELNLRVGAGIPCEKLFDSFWSRQALN